MNEPSPLVEITMAHARDLVPNMSPDIYNKLFSAVSAVLSEQMSISDCRNLFQWSIKTTQPIDRLNLILSTSEEPIPCQSSPEDDSQSLQRKKTRPWSEYEDQRLLAAVHRYGLNNWAMVAKFVGNGRTRAQAAQKWFRGLDPKISKTNWSTHEEEKLLYLLSISGTRGWTFVAHGMGNRSDVQCRYHYQQMLAMSRRVNRHGNALMQPRAMVPMDQVGLPSHQIRSSYSALVLPTLAQTQTPPVQVSLSPTWMPMPKMDLLVPQEKTKKKRETTEQRRMTPSKSMSSLAQAQNPDTHTTPDPLFIHSDEDMGLSLFGDLDEDDLLSHGKMFWPSIEGRSTKPEGIDN